MVMEEFNYLKQLVDERYPMINKYEVEDGKDFFVEGGFYSQLRYIKDHFQDKYSEIIEEMIDTVRRNGKVIFTGDFENPMVIKDGYIFRELEDVLARLKLSFDNKGNPDSDWKD